eukprot:m.13098 g.13098  ORF g.13098 m.13098 type:complete len:238 (+) comp4792_c0_seq1:101-814(+)
MRVLCVIVLISSVHFLPVDSSCKTVSGKQCIFPCYFQDFTITQCTSLNATDPWCCTEVNSKGEFIAGENTWDFCSSDCDADCRTVPDSHYHIGQECIFPCTYEGETKNECFKEDDNLWCCTETDSKGNFISDNSTSPYAKPTWGFCANSPSCGYVEPKEKGSSGGAEIAIIVVLTIAFLGAIGAYVYVSKNNKGIFNKKTKKSYQTQNDQDDAPTTTADDKSYKLMSDGQQGSDNTV